MKKILLIPTLALSVATAAQQKIGNVEFAYSYGLAAGPELPILLIRQGGSGGDVIYHSGGSNSLSVRYCLSKTLIMGITYAYHYFGGYYFTQYRKDFFHYKQHTVTADFKLLYWNGKIVETYALLSAGVSLKERNGYLAERSAYPCAQIDFFGIAVGNRLRGLAEFGFGYKGVLNIGVAYRLKPSGKAIANWNG